MGVTFATVRKIALTFPDIEESTAWGSPSLKVGGSMLACMAIHKSAEPNSLVVRIDMDQRDAMIAEAPDIYYVTDHYLPYPSVLVRLSRIDKNALEDLLQASRRYVVSRNRKKPRRAKPRQSADS